MFMIYHGMNVLYVFDVIEDSPVAIGFVHVSIKLIHVPIYQLILYFISTLSMAIMMTEKKELILFIPFSKKKKRKNS